MIPPNEWVWSTDIEDAVQKMRVDATDQEYYLATVAMVENGVDPHTEERLTKTSLHAWMRHCMTSPEGKHDGGDEQSQTRSMHLAQ